MLMYNPVIVPAGSLISEIISSGARPARLGMNIAKICNGYNKRQCLAPNARAGLFDIIVSTVVVQSSAK